MLGIQRNSLVINLRRNGLFLEAKNGTFREADAPVTLRSGRTTEQLVEDFLALDPPQGFSAAATAHQLGLAKGMHLLARLRGAGFILTPLGGRGPNARKHLVGHYNWEKP